MPTGVYIRTIKVQKVEVSCLFCSKKRMVYQCVLNQGFGKFCNRSCSAKFYVSHLHNKVVWEKISKAKMGVKLSEYHKERMRLSKKMHGKIPWNKGLKATEDKRIKHSTDKAHEAIRGTIAWNKGVKMPQISGEKSHLWKGGITSERQKIYHSIEYKLWREAVFIRDNYTCVKCLSRGGKLQADHIKPSAYFPELKFAIDNGQTLCKDCHYLKTWRVDILFRYPNYKFQQQ
jgi:hypothetical protein